MFERFTDRARRVVVRAQEEARLLDHNEIGTEHVLLGLFHEREGIAAEVLESAHVSIDAARAEVETIAGSGTRSPTGHIPFTRRAKKALENALLAARELGDNFIGTGHLLLGLLSEPQGGAVRVLTALGADLGQIREQATGLAGRERTEQASPVQKPDIQPAPSGYRSVLHCSFCNEPQDKVAKLIAGPGVYICDRCIALCQEILDE